MSNLVCRFSICDLIRVDITLGKKFTRGRRPENRRPIEILKLRQKDIDTQLENVAVTIDQLPQQWSVIREEARKNGVRRYGPEFRMSYNAIVAYVRHHKTNYEYLLREIECMPGGRALYYGPLKDRVDTIVRDALQEQYGRLTVSS